MCRTMLSAVISTQTAKISISSSLFSSLIGLQTFLFIWWKKSAGLIFNLVLSFISWPFWSFSIISDNLHQQLKFPFSLRTLRGFCSSLFRSWGSVPGPFINCSGVFSHITWSSSAVSVDEDHAMWLKVLEQLQYWMEVKVTFCQLQIPGS